MIERNPSNFTSYEVMKSQDQDRNKIYYGFLHNYSSENTRKAYFKDLKKFIKFLAVNFKGINEFQVEHAHVVAFKEYLLKEQGERTANYSNASINRTLACLWAFYEYLIDSKKISRNPVERVKRFRVSKEVKTSDLTDDQVETLLNVIPDDNGSGKLHRAILTLFFNTGMRHSEVANLKFKNLDYENEFTVIRYRAKGDKEMVTPLNQRTLDAIGSYLKWCQVSGYSMESNDYLFRPTKNPKDENLNKKLDSKSFSYMIKKYAKEIGILGNVTIHSARSTVIGKLLDMGHSIDRVADFVGHKDISTTKAYNKRRVKIQNSLSFDL
jgi:integrase/recombinase XerD